VRRGDDHALSIHCGLGTAGHQPLCHQGRLLATYDRVALRASEIPGHGAREYAEGQVADYRR